MRSNSGSEKIPGFLPKGRLSIILCAAMLFVLSAAGRPAMSAVTLTRVARIVASSDVARGKVSDVFAGYTDLGLRREAAAYLERAIQLGAISREDATPLFERIAREQSRWDDPDDLLAICETAIRNGAGTPAVTYSYGTALRQLGRLAEASSIFARIAPDSPYYPYGLYAVGQIAAEERRGESAEGVFGRVREILRKRGHEDTFSRRVLLSQAELLLTLRRPREAAGLLALLPGEVETQSIAGVVRAAADNVADAGTLWVSPETVAQWPVRRRILLDLLQGGVARESGRFAEALGHFNRAQETIQSSVASSTAPATETVLPYEPVELLRRQVEHHRQLRSRIASLTAATPESMAKQVVELLVNLLFIDRSMARTARSMPELPGRPEVTYLSRSQAEEIMHAIERASLGGVDADGLIGGLAKKLDVFQNLAHPIERYRLLTRLEKSQVEIRAIRQTIHENRESAISGVEERSGKRVPASRFLEEMGRFLVELDRLDEATRDAQAFMERNFDILETKAREAGPTLELFENTTRRALATDEDAFRTLLPSIVALEQYSRIVSWDRQRLEIAALRPVVSRRIADCLVQEARSFRAERTAEGREQARTSLERAVSYLRGDALSSRGRVETAIQIGSFLEEGESRWEPFPGKTAGKWQQGVIASILPILEGIRSKGQLREEGAYLVVSLKIRAGDPGAQSAAERFLREFSSSPFADRIAVRMGHEALLRGRFSEAKALYQKAAGSPEFATAAAARYMLAWFQFRTGDSSGAAAELSPEISDPSFRCDGPSPFERAVLTLAVQAWADGPLEALDSYPPVRQGVCGGRLLLLSLGKEEDRRGEADRSAVVYGVLAERFTNDAEALTYERKAVDSFLRAGKENQAFARILRLEEKYGPGTAWARARPPHAREQARKEMISMLEMISEKKFEEGVRTGKAGAMAAARTGMEHLLSVKGDGRTDEDAGLRLKLAIASLKAGDRDTGVAILKKLAEGGETSEGERAAILYAETRIAAYERKEDTAEGAEDAAQLLLERYPSKKAVGLAYRAAAALLSNANYAGAKNVAEEIEKSAQTPKPVLYDAQLVYAEAAVFTKDFAAARKVAESLLESPSKDVRPKARERARNLFVLASLKESEAKTAVRDWTGAGRTLEDLEKRFPDDPEASNYLLRAFRLYRRGGDMDAAAKAGMRFLNAFPARKEAAEVAGAVGPFLVEQGELGKAADLYAGTARRLPKGPEAPAFLFLAAQLSVKNGDPRMAAKRFASYRDKYPEPRWRWAYATISIGLLAWERGDATNAIRALEEGIRRMDAGVEKDAPRELFEIKGKGILILGEYWAKQFRKLKLVEPLEKSLAIKERFFRRALALFDKAAQESPTVVAIRASQLSGDLFVDFGKAILDAQRPKGLQGEESERFEKALSRRAEGFFEKGMARYLGALDRLEAGAGPSDLVEPIRERIEKAQVLLAGTNRVQRAK